MVDTQSPDSTSPMDCFVSVRDLFKGYDNSGSRIEILKGLNIDLNAGETLAIVGASGIGKSTLLHILGALDRPDGGAYFFKGDDIFLFDQIVRLDAKGFTLAGCLDHNAIFKKSID